MSRAQSPEEERMAQAVRYFGAGAPADVLAAKARLYGPRPYLFGTAEERAAVDADIAVVDAFEATIQPYDLPGPDPMGDEA